MKTIKRLFDEDLRELAAIHFGVEKDKVVSVFTEEPDEDDNVTPVFYIEVEI